MQIPKQSLDHLYTAMLNIAEHRSLVGCPTSHRGKIGAIEGVSHELAHQLEMGRHFEERLRTMTDTRADAHEMAALRIEVTALTTLGLALSLQRLWKDANWQGDRPQLTAARRVLSLRERKCVRAFVQIVNTASGREATAGRSVKVDLGAIIKASCIRVADN